MQGIGNGGALGAARSHDPGGVTYPGQVQNAPRELGLIERVQGVASASVELVDKIEATLSRLSGQGIAEGAVGGNHGQPIAGIEAPLSCAEDRMRRAHQLIDGLAKAL